jgi:hypothetical protein
MWSDAIQNRFVAQQRLHLTELSCAEIEVTALAQVVLGRRPSGIRSNRSQELWGERMRCATLAALSSGIMLLTSVDQGFQEGQHDE